MADLTDITVDPEDDGYIHILKSDIEEPFDQTEDEIRERMQDRIAQIFKDRDIKPDFREGSLLNTLLSPAAKELSIFYEEMNVLLSLGFLETTVLGYLDAKGVELGVTRIAANPSRGDVRFLGDDPRLDVVDPLTVTPVYIPPGTIVSTVATDPEAIPQQFEIQAVPSLTQPIDAERHTIKGTPNPALLEGWGDGVVEPTYLIEPYDIADVAGPVIATGITGNVMYKITYVTTLGMKYLGVFENPDYEEGFGETLASERSFIFEDLIDQKIKISVDVPPVYSGLNTIYQVNVYRALDDGGGFSEFKLVGTINTNDGFADEVWDLTDNVNFEVSEAFLQDTNTTGVVQLPSVSLEASEEANIAERTIEILEDTIDGVTKVTNPTQFSDGRDEESDDDYRDRLLLTIQKVPGAGTVQDYVDWALEVPGISAVTVVPEWEEKFGYPNGPGTVLVQVAGEDGIQVNSVLVERVRKHIAGDISVINPYLYMDVANGGVAKLSATAVARGDGDVQPGTYEYVYTYVTVGGGETEHNAIKPVEIITVDPWAGTEATFNYSEVEVVTVGPLTNAVELTGLTSGPSGVSVENTVYRRIYRRLQGALDVNGDPDDRFYLVGIQFNTEPDPNEFIDILNIPFERYAPVVNSTSMFNGVAPIGAHITVESIDEFSVTVEAHIVPDPGYTLSGLPGGINLKPALDASLAAFFQTISAGGRVYYTDILNAIHDTVGVQDFYGVTVSAAGFDDLDGTVGHRYWQLAGGTDIIYNDDGSVFIEEIS
jgi:uncharacterized phage protein gp47/JayE